MAADLIPLQGNAMHNANINREIFMSEYSCQNLHEEPSG